MLRRRDGSDVVVGSSPGTFNVTDFGAACDGTTDDYAAIQGTIDAAAALATINFGPPTVALPANKRCLVGTPLRIRATGQSLVGTGNNAQQTTLTTNFAGPTIVVAPASYTLPTYVSGLTADGGNAVQLQTDNQHWNLSQDGPSINNGPTNILNGLSAFSVEAWVKQTDSTATLRSIVGSSGQIDSTGIAEAFGLVSNGVDLYGQIKIGTGSLLNLLCTGALPLNTTTHVAMTYDGSTVRVFSGGVQCQSHSATGNLKQTPHEDLIIGAMSGLWPDASFLFGSFRGVIDSVRISQNARYTSNFTPFNGKLGVDGNTIYSVTFGAATPNFDIFTFVSGFVVHHNPSFWMAFRDSGQTPPQFDGVTIKNLLLTGPATNGIYLFYAHRWTLDHVRVLETSFATTALLAWCNNFFGHLIDVELQSAAMPLVMSIQNGLIQGDQVHVEGGYFQSVIAGGGISFNTPIWAPSDFTAFSLVGLDSATILLSQPSFDAEISPVNNYQSIYLANNGTLSALQIIGGEFQSVGGLGPILVDSWDQLNLLGGRFTTSGESNIVQFNSAPSTKCNIIGASQFSSLISWVNNSSYCGILP